jgi:hypothetical protein
VTLVPVELYWSPAYGYTSSMCCCISSTADPISFPATYPSLKARGWVGFSMAIVIVFAPHGFKLCENVKEGNVIRTGQLLLRLPEQRPSP